MLDYGCKIYEVTFLVLMCHLCCYPVAISDF